MSFLIVELGIQTPLVCGEGTAVKRWTHRNIPRSARSAWCYRVDVIIVSEVIVGTRIAEHVPPPLCERSC